MPEALIGGATALVSALIAGLVTWVVARERILSERSNHQHDLAHREELHRAELEASRQSLDRELQFRSREVLRDEYGRFLVAQRRYREASRQLAVAGGTSEAPDLDEAARTAAAEFIEHYNAMKLDASVEMWRDARSLRRALNALLNAPSDGDDVAAERFANTARLARRNLEGSLRTLLGNEPLRPRVALDEPDEYEARLQL